MKNKFVSAMIATMLLASMLSFAGTTVKAYTETEPFTDLIADGGSVDTAVDVGDVFVWNDEDNLYVKYVTSGWWISEVHLEVDTDLEGIPQSKGNPVPGKFTYGEKGLWTQEYLFDPIPLNSLSGTELYIAAHAKVWEEASLTSMTIVSEPGVDVYGPSSTYLPVGDTNWVGPNPAVATWVHDSWPSISDATWISTNDYVEDPVADSWRWFRDSFVVPGYPASGTVSVAATSDNAEEVYFNGVLIGSEGEVQGPFSDDYEWNTIVDYGISPQMGLNTLDFIVRNYEQSGGTTISNPTGLIYKAEIQYYAREETAWGAGTTFPGKNWATYFKYTVQGWNSLETIEVPATGTKMTSTNTLQAGHQYKFVASGTCNWRVPGSTAGYLGDAEYWFRHDSYGEGWTKMGIWSLAMWDGTAVDIDWGDYNEDHVYTYYFTPSSTGTVTFFFNDDVYRDNSGILTVTIYEWS
ncbi:MAG: hypothetical protein ABC585_07755 [Candidatus Methanosuratincola petrocarbonis]